MKLRLCATVFLTLLVMGASAADKPKFYDQVLAVDATSITLYRSPTKEAKFKITSGTKVVVNYRQATITDVKVGMKATVYRKGDTDEAGSITARSMPGY